MPTFEFTTEEAEARWTALHVACQDFVEDLKPILAEKKYDVGLDQAVLYDVMVSANHDIERYKSWHQDNPKQQKSDAIKRAAYFTKWLTRLRPIWVSRPTGYFPERRDRSVFLNERFALEWALANLSFELDRKCPTPTPDKLFQLLYDLHYRELSDDALLHIFQLYYDLARGTQIFLDLDRV